MSCVLSVPLSIQECKWVLENCLRTLQIVKGLSVMRRCCGIVVSVLLTQGPWNVGLRPGWSLCCVLGLDKVVSLSMGTNTEKQIVRETWGNDDKASYLGGVTVPLATSFYETGKKKRWLWWWLECVQTSHIFNRVCFYVLHLDGLKHLWPQLESFLSDYS